MPNTADGWFIVQLKPNGLGNALRNLDRQGFQSFLPRQTVTRRQRDKLVAREEPIFPGYLFVTFDPATTPWRRINGTLGVARLITTASLRPVMVPPAFMAGLFDRCSPDGILAPRPELEVGDIVRIRTGPFADVISQIDSLDRNGRVAILLEIMGQAVRISVPSENLSRET